MKSSWIIKSSKPQRNGATSGGDFHLEAHSTTTFRCSFVGSKSKLAILSGHLRPIEQVLRAHTVVRAHAWLFKVVKMMSCIIPIMYLFGMSVSYVMVNEGPSLLGCMCWLHPFKANTALSNCHLAEPSIPSSVFYFGHSYPISMSLRFLLSRAAAKLAVQRAI